LITLTLVDLPGIARVPVGDQPEEWLGRDKFYHHHWGGKEAIGVNFYGGFISQTPPKNIFGVFLDGVIGKFLFGLGFWWIGLLTDFFRKPGWKAE